MRSLAIFLFIAPTLFGGEYAVLSNGFKIHAESHVVEADKVRLQRPEGAIEIPAASVVSFESEEYAAPPPPAIKAISPTAAPVVSSPALSPKELVTQAALEAGLPPALVHSLVRAESGYHPGALSPKGAIGLMQLMPATAAALNANPYDVKQNVAAGVSYLRDLLIRYQDDPHQVTKALAAYNAGPGAVDRYNGVPPYRETINYVNRIVQQYLKDHSPDADRTALLHQ